MSNPFTTYEQSRSLVGVIEPDEGHLYYWVSLCGEYILCVKKSLHFVPVDMITYGALELHLEAIPAYNFSQLWEKLPRGIQDFTTITHSVDEFTLTLDYRSREREFISPDINEAFVWLLIQLHKEGVEL